jgi:predicted nuclease with TOPRIM domain
LNEKEIKIKDNQDIINNLKEELKRLNENYNEKIKNEKELKKQLEELEKYKLEKEKEIQNLKDNEKKNYSKKWF